MFAIQKSMTLASGVDMTAACIVIQSISIDEINSITTINVCIYKDWESYQLGRQEVIMFKHHATGDNYNTYFSNDVLLADNISPRKQAYTFLKTLPAYIGAAGIGGGP